MNKTNGCGFVCVLLALATGACMNASDHASRLGSSRAERLTVGIVQREIRMGMSQADVAGALGSPNIVTKDTGGTQTWIYDKIATEASYSYGSGGVSGAAGAGGMPGSRALVLGGVGAGYSGSSGAASTSQRTLTIIIKFNDVGQVKDFSYHSSRF